MRDSLTSKQAGLFLILLDEVNSPITKSNINLNRKDRNMISV